MYAVIRTGGKQYRVMEGTILRVESLEGAKGDAVTLDDVILIGDTEGDIKTGEAVANSQVTAHVLGQGRHKKITVFKKKRRKDYRRKQGHRQNYTELKIQAISA